MLTTVTENISWKSWKYSHLLEQKIGTRVCTTLSHNKLTSKEVNVFEASSISKKKAYEFITN